MSKKRVNLTIDADMWKRCQQISAQYDFVNWSEIAETSFLQILVVLDRAAKAHQQGETVESITDQMLLYFQSQYHEALSETYKAVNDYQTKNSVIVSQPQK